MIRRFVPVAIVAALIVVGVVLSLSAGEDDAGPAQGSTVVVGQSVWEALEEQPSVQVLIGLRQPDVPLAERTTDLMRQSTAERAARVLAELTEDDFVLIHQFEISAALGGNVTRSGVKKLAAHPDVVSVGLSCCGSVGNLDIQDQ